MSMAAEILETLESLGVAILVIGPDRLRLQPASKIPPELLPRIREAKPEILEALRSRHATCGPTCYEIEPGRWIHHRWHGCKTPVSPKTANSATQAECKHCDGAGECSCPGCTLRRTEKPVPCLMCQPEKRQLWLTATRPEGCWHCEGSGKCRCISCGRPGVCRVCAGSGNQRVQ
jgi:hypothetical protein